MTAEIIILIFALIFLALGIILFCGKWLFLVAGYNMMTSEEKEKYDRKKVGRSAGAICFSCAVMLCAMAYFGYKVDTGAMAEDGMLVFALVFVAVITATVVLASRYMNSKGKK